MIVSFEKKSLIIYIFLFLCTVNFGGVGIYVCPIILLGLLYWKTKRNSFYLTKSVNSLCVLLYAMTFTIGKLFWNEDASITIVIEGIIMFAYFELGKKLAECNSDKMIMKELIAIGIGGTFYGGMNVYLQKYNELASYYSQAYLERVCRDVWTGNVLYATVNAQFFICTISLLGLAIFMMKKSEKWLVIIANIISIYCILKIQSRTILYLSFIEILLVFSLILISNTRYINRIKENIKYIALIIILLIILVVLWENNVNDIQNIFYNSNMYKRFVVEGNGLSTMGLRTEIHKFYLGRIYNYPLGGIPSYNNIPSSHNMILESAKYGGWLALLLILIIMLSTTKNIFFIIKKKKLINMVTLALVCVFAGYFVCYMMEAPQSSNVGQFGIFLLIIGMIEQRGKNVTASVK